MDSFLSLFDPGLSSEEPPSSKNWERNGNLSGQLDSSNENLPPEPQYGNIEYKLKLVNPTRQRFEHLVTQMKWRLREGQNEALYEIGVEDSGVLRGLSPDEMTASLKTLNEMAFKLGATTIVLRETTVGHVNGVPKTVAEVLVRKTPNESFLVDLRIAVMGVQDVGKSTLLGVLTNGTLDNGKGRARLNMFRHLHEIQSGRTSSITHDLIGFDSNGNAINYQEGTPETICELSSKVVTLIDLCGHQKYLKTTIRGITGYRPHYLLFVISSSSGLTRVTKEHLSLALALQIPLVIVVTKTDLSSHQQLKQLFIQLKEYLNSLQTQRVAVCMNSVDDVISLTSSQPNETEVPIVLLSSVTGEGVDLLKKLLFLLPPSLSPKERQRLEQMLPEFQIDETFKIPQVGGQSQIILGGLLTQGVISEGEKLLLGPMYDGKFRPVTVTSIRRHKIPVLAVKASQSASIALDDNDNVGSLRKGMVLIHPSIVPISCFYFEASICVLYHRTAISKGFQTTVHLGNVKQTAVVAEILSHSKSPLATNDRASVVFKFINRPEYIKVGSRLLFREGNTKGYGNVTQVYEYIPSTPGSLVLS